MPLLKNQTSDTIDDFIVENEDVADLTKQCIATVFIRRIYQSREQHKPLMLKDLSRRAFRFKSKNETAYSERNWVHHFINLVRKGIRAGDVSSENKIRVISFNYDNILEFILDEQFDNTGYEYGDWHDFIEIIHPHGQCGIPPKTLKNPAELACKWAEGIFVVNEKEGNISDKVAAEREKAKSWIKAAKKIYALGFAFSGPNLKLLGLTPDVTPKHNRLISYCNYDGNVGLRRSLARFKREQSPVVKTLGGQQKRIYITVEVEEANGERNNPMNCSDWFKLGYPGEPPS